MKVAIYPGTFDPPTVGHIDIARRSSVFFDKLYVAVGTNSLKQHPLFTKEERVELLKRVFHSDKQIEVIAFDGLLVEFAKQRSISVAIRSIRNCAEIDFEISQATLNRQMTGLETFWMSAQPVYRDISSTLIREIGRGGGILNDFVPAEILDDVTNKLR